MRAGGRELTPATILLLRGHPLTRLVLYPVRDYLGCGRGRVCL